MCSLTNTPYEKKEVMGYKIAIELHDGRLVSPVTGIVYKVGTISQRFSNYDWEEERKHQDPKHNRMFHNETEQITTGFVTPARVKEWSRSGYITEKRPLMYGRTAVFLRKEDALNYLGYIAARIKIGEAVLLKITLTRGLKAGNVNTNWGYLSVVAGRYIKAMEKVNVSTENKYYKTHNYH